MAMMQATPTPTPSEIPVPKGSVLFGTTLHVNPEATEIWLMWLDEAGEIHTVKLRKPVTIREE